MVTISPNFINVLIRSLGFLPSTSANSLTVAPSRTSTTGRSSCSSGGSSLTSVTVAATASCGLAAALVALGALVLGLGSPPFKTTAVWTNLSASTASFVRSSNAGPFRAAYYPDKFILETTLAAPHARPYGLGPRHIALSHLTLFLMRGQAAIETARLGLF